MVGAADRHEEKTTGICAAGALTNRHMPVRMSECGCHYSVAGLRLFVDTVSISQCRSV